MHLFDWNAYWNSDLEDNPLRMDEISQKRVVALVNKKYPNGAEIIHFGAGDGYLAEQLEEYGHSVLCIDSSDAAVERAKEAGLKAECKNLQINNFSEWERDSFDVVLVTHVLEALDEPHQLMRLAELVLKEDGFFGMQLYKRQYNPKLKKHEGISPFDDAEVENLLQATFWPGFDIRNEMHDEGRLGMLFCGEMPEETLSLCLILWNEAPFLKKCLESVPYDELIIGIDDSSNDLLNEDGTLNLEERAESVEQSDTYKIALEYVEKAGLNSQVFIFPHMVEGTDSYDFSSRRNLGFEKAEADWIIQIDGHEYLNPVAKEAVKLNIQWSGEKEIFHFIMHRGGLQYHVPHIWENNRKYKYRKKVHNVLGSADDEKIPDEVRHILKSIHCFHKWTDEKKEERAEQRNKSNVFTLLKEAEEEPDSPRPWFFLGNTYMSLREIEKAQEAYEKCLEIMGSSKGDFKYQTLLLLGKLLGHMEKYDEAKEKFLQLFELNQDRNEHFIHLGDIAMIEERYDLAERYFLIASTYKKPPITYMFAEESKYSWEPYQRLYIVNFKKGQFAKARDGLKVAINLMPKNKYLEDKDMLVNAFKELEEKL